MVILRTDIHKKVRFITLLVTKFSARGPNRKTLQPEFYFQCLSISNMAANALFMTTQGYSCSS
jgi:hypothetical protein